MHRPSVTLCGLWPLSTMNLHQPSGLLQGGFPNTKFPATWMLVLIQLPLPGASHSCFLFLQFFICLNLVCRPTCSHVKVLVSPIKYRATRFLTAWPIREKYPECQHCLQHDLCLVSFYISALRVLAQIGSADLRKVSRGSTLFAESRHLQHNVCLVSSTIRIKLVVWQIWPTDPDNILHIELHSILGFPKSHFALNSGQWNRYFTSTESKTGGFFLSSIRSKTRGFFLTSIASKMCRFFSYLNRVQDVQLFPYISNVQDARIFPYLNSVKDARIFLLPQQSPRRAAFSLHQ